MNYKSLQTSDLLNQVESVDVNNVVIYNIDATKNFETEIVDGFNNIEFLIVPNSITGSGTLKYYESLDKINFTQVKQDDNVTNVEFTISSDAVKTLKDFNVTNSYYKFVYDAGTVSVGTIVIKAWNG